jgi:hypothetical protein
MSGDRFDAELRDVLREEAGHAPVVLSLGDLRARAGSRSRWPRLTGASRLAFGAAVAGIAVVVFAIGLGPNRSQPSVGGTPSPQASPAPSSAAVAPSASAPSVTTPPAVLPIDMGPTGTVVAVRTNGTRLDVVASGDGGSERTIATIPSLKPVLGEWRLEEDSHGAISATGRLALAVTRGDVDHPELATAIINLSLLDQPANFADPGPIAFLPDGTLVIGLDDTHVVRLAPPYDGAGERKTLPAAVRLASPLGGGAGRSLSLLADGTGVVGAQSVELANGDPASYTQAVACSWDGSTPTADPAGDPLLVTGADRQFGADGQSAYLWSDSGPAGGSGGLAVEGPSTPRVNVSVADPKSFAWRPGGRQLIVVDGSILKSFDGAKATKLADLAGGSGGGSIVGFTSDSALLVGSDGLTYRVLFDGSATWTIGGFVVGVVG